MADDSFKNRLLRGVTLGASDLFTVKERIQKASKVAAGIEALTGEPTSASFRKFLEKPGMADEIGLQLEGAKIKQAMKIQAEKAAIPVAAEKASATTLASEKAKLDPSIVSGKLDVRAQEKQQDLGFKAEEQFLDIQKQILQKGVDLDATEKQRLVFAEQGAKNVQIAQGLLNDKNFTQAVFQSSGGTIGKLSTAGNTQLRNYNTAIESAFVSYVFANTGATASDKERANFRSIYGAQIGDTLENVRFKNQLISDFFTTAKDILDPNKVAGLSVAELKGKMNEIKQQMDALGKGDSQEAKTLIKLLQEKAIGIGGDDQSSVLKNLGLDPNKYELVEE